MIRIGALMVSLGLLFGILASGEEEQRILFIAENEFGKVWANLGLTRQRDSEPYLPIAIAVYNKVRKPIELDRERFWLSDLDGLVYPMPSVKELRKNYDRQNIDLRMVSFNGIPWEGWRARSRLTPASFFPGVKTSRGNTVIDLVTLRKGYAMVDLLYFERPRGSVLNKPFFLEVHPKGWEVPIRLRLYIS